MRLIFLALLALAVTACAAGQPEFAKPADNAPEWELNQDIGPGNAMIQPPTGTVYAR